MNQAISLILAGTCAVSSGYVSSTATPPPQSRVHISINLAENYNFTSAQAADFLLSDGVNTYSETVPVSESREQLNMSFCVNEYTPGTEFTLTPVSGVESIIYNGTEYALGQPITVPTSYEKTEDGDFSVTNSAVMSYKPIVSNTVTAYFNNEAMQLPVPATVIDGVVMLPIEKTAEYMKIPVRFDSASNSYTMSNKDGYLGLYMNNVYTASKTDFNAPVAPTLIDGVAFASAKVIADAFGAPINISQNDSGYTVSMNYTPPETPEENYVNNAGLSSQTSYLIWVSKQNFRVHVFSGQKGQWTLLKSLRCSIGAPSTPTCEGTYRYYEPIKKWDYGSYYVGPVMRFNGGYALHSTLVNNNGTLRDGRLEKMISHGCVRIDPPDMNWLFATIPLYTTVHVTRY